MSASHKLTAYNLNVSRGDGLVARMGDVVMYIAESTASADRLLAVVQSAAHAERPGASVAERLAALAFGANPVRTAFGVVAPTADGLLVLLRGNISAEIDAAGRIRTISGERALTWVDEIVPTPVRRISIADRSGTAPPHPHTDLREGVVPGGGFVLCREAVLEQRPAGTESVAAETMQVLEPTQAARSPVETAPSPSPAMETSSYVPFAGFLESDDGAAYPLDRNYVIGRDPLQDDTVRNAAASPITVHQDQHVSRVHAYVSIEGASVFARDAGTPGGTFIAAPGAEDWTQIGTTPTELEPGWSLRVGDRIMIYRTRR